MAAFHPRNLGRQLARAAASSTTLALTTALAAGVVLSSCVAQFTLTFGTSLPVRSGLLAALCVLAAGCLRICVRRATQAKSKPLFAIAPLVGLALAGAGFPFVLSSTTAVLGQFTPETLAIHSVLAGMMFALSGTVFAVPVYCAIAGAFSLRTATGANTQAIYCLGFALGLPLNTLLIAPAAGLWIAALCAAGVLATSALFVFRQSQHDESADASIDNAADSVTPPVELAFTAVGAMCVGGGVCVLFRVAAQFMTATIWTSSVQSAALILGFALALRFRRGRESGGAGGAFATAVWTGVCLAGYQSFLLTSLWLNATVSQPVLLVSARALLLLAMFVPIGFSAARAACTASAGQWNGIVSLLCAGLGYIVADALAISRLGLPETALACVFVGGAVAVCQTAATRSLPRTRTARAGWLLGAAVILATPWSVQSYAPLTSSKWLFDTNVFVAYRNGTPTTSLSFLDDARPLGTLEGERATYTVWRQRGSQVVVREGGIPASVASSDTRVLPHYAPELVQAVVPLALHESPQRVLLLGLGGGVTLDASLMFPVREVVCAEPDDAVVKIVAEIVESPRLSSALHEDRVRLIDLDAPLALAAASRRFDVIVSNPLDGSLASHAACFTEDFYDRAADRLADAGIFCQRFRHFDLGAEAVATTLATFRGAFEHVAVLEITGGERLLLGTNSSATLVRGDVFERFHRPQVRQTLAGLGWDWSVLLNISGLGNEGLDALSSEENPRPSRAGNGISAMRTPLEILRWADKMSEVRTLLAAHQQLGFLVKQIASSQGESEAYREFAHRNQELATQHRLMGTLHDEWWRYRSAVKSHLSKQSRSVIEQVSGSTLDRTLHPEDRRRLLYVQALGQAGRRKRPTNASIEGVARFTQPYDPLLSYFIHHEVAELYSRAADPNPAAELRHRLHTVYFGGPADHGVRNIVATIELLTRDAAAEPDPVRRRDQLCGLLQVLKYRWNLRRSVTPESPRGVLDDIQKSVAAVESAFEAVDVLTDELGLSQSDWLSQRQFVQRQLLRPLRTYRARVLPHEHRSSSKRGKPEQSPSL
ncbi:MAG: hypothetical protein CMJ48_06390 [Planctomycetaceae bacterium]|nr:hypothetical protein [Planctomycetaceae bacterium]